MKKIFRAVIAIANCGMWYKLFGLHMNAILLTMNDNVCICLSTWLHCTANIRLKLFFRTDIIFDTFRFYNGFSMIILAVLFVATACSALSVNNLVDIVIAVKHYFRSGCVCLLHDEGNGKSWESHIITKIFFFYQFVLLQTPWYSTMRNIL